MVMTAEALAAARQVKLVIFDVDGVLTDGGIYIGPQGELFKAFNAKDGLGVSLWHKAGGKTAIITGRTSEQLSCRAQELGISRVWQGQRDKRAAYRELKEAFGLADEEIAYIGDDLIDLPVMLQVGFTGAPADASPEVRRIASVVSGLPGGHGAVREVLEFLLKAQGKWEALLGLFAVQPADAAGLAQ